MLVDTVSRIQKDMAILREENRALRTPATSQVIQVPGGRHSRLRKCRGSTELLVGNNIIRCLKSSVRSVIMLGPGTQGGGGGNSADCFPTTDNI